MQASHACTADCRVLGTSVMRTHRACSVASPAATIRQTQSSRRHDRPMSADCGADWLTDRRRGVIISNSRYFVARPICRCLIRRPAQPRRTPAPGIAGRNKMTEAERERDRETDRQREMRRRRLQSARAMWLLIFGASALYSRIGIAKRFCSYCRDPSSSSLILRPGKVSGNHCRIFCFVPMTYSTKRISGDAVWRL